jgi:queuosine precursor transporter
MNLSPRAILWVAAYIAAIVLVNWTFLVLAPMSTPLGDLYVANLIVGAVFVLRDYAQRLIGHKILFATAVAGIITYFMVDKALAVASIIAFILSETTDWAIYSFTKKPLQQRILVSSLFSVPIDTLAFQYLAQYLSPASFSTEVVSKAVGVMIVWQLLKLRAAAEPVPAA